MTSENRTQQSTRVGPKWLTVQTASLAAMAIIVLSGAAGFALIGELHFAAVLGMIAVLPLVLKVIFARAGQGAAWSTSPHGRDIYERQAWTKPIFGAYRSLTDIRRVTLAFAITALLTLLVPFWLLSPVLRMQQLVTPLILDRVPADTTLSRVVVPGFQWGLQAAIMVGVFAIVYTALRRNGMAATEMTKYTGAYPLPTGSAPQATAALGRISTALGFPYPPVLRVIPTAAVNAWVAGPREHVGIAITSGMLETFPPRELEAVFADLLVRAADPLVSDLSQATERFARNLRFGVRVPRVGYGAVIGDH